METRQKEQKCPFFPSVSPSLNPSLHLFPHFLLNLHFSPTIDIHPSHTHYPISLSLSLSLSFSLSVFLPLSLLLSPSLSFSIFSPSNYCKFEFSTFFLSHTPKSHSSQYPSGGFSIGRRTVGTDAIARVISE